MTHDILQDSLTDRSIPTRTRVGADRIGSDLGADQGSAKDTPLVPSMTSGLGTNVARESVPFEQYEELNRRLDEMGEELAATRKALTKECKANDRLKKQLDVIREVKADEKAAKEIPDGDVILKFLGWWRDYTNRPTNTKIDLTTTRASLVRKALKHWSPQELCWMVVGMSRDPWYSERGLTDIKHMLKDEAMAERFLKRGRPS